MRDRLKITYSFRTARRHRGFKLLSTCDAQWLVSIDCWLDTGDPLGKSPVTSGSVAEDKCQAMEYLTEAHVALARRHLQEIQGRITELKDAAAKHSSLPPDALLSPGR